MKIALSAVACVACFVLMVLASIAEERAWQQYALDHHCAAVGIVEGATSTVIDSQGGVSSFTTPDQTIYRCDGGEEHIR